MHRERRIQKFLWADVVTLQQQTRIQVAAIVRAHRIGWDGQWKEQHVEQCFAECDSKARSHKATPNQRPHPKKLGMQQQQGIIPTRHVGPTLVDASMVCRRRDNAGASRKRRQDRQRQLDSGLLCDGVSRQREGHVPNCPHNGGKRIIDNVWQPTVLSYEQRSTSDKTPANTALNQKHQRQGACKGRGAF